MAMTTRSAAKREDTTKKPSRDGEKLSAQPLKGAAVDQRQRKVGFAASGVLLATLAMGFFVFALGARGERVAVVVTDREIPAGAVVTRDMLRVERIAKDVNVRGIPSSGIGLLVGKVSSRSIPADTFLAAEDLGERPQPPAGFVLAGFVVQAGEAPLLSFRNGDRLQLISAAAEGGGVITTASVWSVAAFDDSQRSSGRAITLAIPDDSKVDVLRVQALGQLRMVLERGGPVWSTADASEAPAPIPEVNPSDGATPASTVPAS